MIRRLPAVFLIVPAIAGCASINQALTTVNQALSEAAVAKGGRCIRVTNEVGAWDSQTNSYDMGTSMVRDASGNDISTKEHEWAQSRVDYFSTQAFGDYYDTSPYSKVEYKFRTWCAEWASQ